MLSHSKSTTVNFWPLLFILCFSLTLLDIVVVEGYFRPMQAWNSILIWHMIYRIIFITIPLIACYFFRHFAPLATWFFFIFGLEDTLFYALQGYLPLNYPGVYVLWFWEPSLNLVLQMNFLGLIAILLFGIYASKKSTNLFYHIETLVNKVQQPINTAFKQEKNAHSLGD